MTVKIIDNLGETIPGVNIYESDSEGNSISGGFYTSTDVNGYADVPTDIPYVTFSFVGMNPEIFQGDNVPGVVELSPADYSYLDAVEITAKPSYITEIILYSSLAIIIFGIIYLFRKKIFKF